LRRYTISQTAKKWVQKLLDEYDDFILNFDKDVAHLCGYLRVPHPENAINKQIAETALIYDLTLISRNLKGFRKTGVKILDLFES